MGAKQSADVVPTGSKSPLDRVIEPECNVDVEFIQRARGTILEGEYDILFNLLLVKHGIRPAYLIEGGNFEHIDRYLSEIKRIYPEFQQTVESEIDGQPHRVFLHSQPLTSPIGKDSDEWVAENLGFYCKGIASPDLDRTVIRYELEADYTITNFYAEICIPNNFSQDFFDKKLDLFNSIARPLGWNVKMTVSPLRADSLNYFANLIQTNELDIHQLEELVEELEGYGVTMLKTNIDEGRYTLEQLRKDRELLLFGVAMAMADPMQIYYPLTTETALTLEPVAAASFSQLGENPVDQYERYNSSSEVQTIVHSSPEKVVDYNGFRLDMLELYQDFLKNMVK
jgi:hypothetical protein